eukprot:s3723_g7.t22
MTCIPFMPTGYCAAEVAVLRFEKHSASLWFLLITVPKYATTASPKAVYPQARRSSPMHVLIDSMQNLSSFCCWLPMLLLLSTRHHMLVLVSTAAMALSLDGSLPAFLSSRWPSCPWPCRPDVPRTCVTGTGRHVWSLSVFVMMKQTHAGRHTIFARASRRQTGKALQLSRDIGRLTQPEDILAFVEDHVHEFSFVHAVSCFSRLGRMRHRTRQSWSASEPFQNLIAAIDVFGERGEMDTEALRATLVAAVYLANGDMVRQMVSKCATALLTKLPAASLTELANSTWALAKLEHRNEKLLRGVSSEVLRRVAVGQAMSVRDVQKLVWALAAFGWRDLSLFRCLSAEVQRCNDFSAVDASVIAFSFARLGVEDAALFRVLSQHVQDRLLIDLNAQGIAKVAYSFAVLGHAADEPRLFRALAAESARRIAAFGAQELANLMQALVWCRASGCAIFASSEVQRFLPLASRRCTELCHSAIPKDLCCFAWSFASLGSHCATVLPAVAEASIHRLSDFDPRFLSGQLAWSFASTGTINPSLFDAIAVAAVDRMRSYAPRDISNLAWSFAMLGHRNHALFDSLCSRALLALERFNSQDLANMLWAYSHLGIRAPALFAASEEQVKATISRPSLQELSSIAWAYENACMMSSALLLAIECEFARRLLLGPGKARPAQRARDVKALLRQLRPYSQFARLSQNPRIPGLRAQFQGRPLWFNQDASEDLLLARRRVLQSSFKQIDVSKLAASVVSPPVAISHIAGRQVVCGMTLQREQKLSFTSLEKCRMRSCPLSARVDMASMSGGFAVGAELPRFELDLSDRSVLYKPPGWEVQGSGELGHDQLSAFVRWTVPQKLPILHDGYSSYGFLHRLDVSTSGLVLHAKSYEAYHDLDLQLLRREIDREYLVLVHGLVSPARISLLLPVYVGKDSESRPSQVAVPGARFSLSHLKVLAHLGPRQSTSLLTMKIDTGRRHQIRAQTSHVGHAVVCDWLYTARPTYSTDKEWCCRTFLHRHRLAFKDKDGKQHDVTLGLPEDLRNALASFAASLIALPRHRSCRIAWDAEAPPGSGLADFSFRWWIFCESSGTIAVAAAAAGGAAAAAAVHGASRPSSKSAWEKPAAEARQDQMKARTEKPEVPFTAPATPPRRRTPRRPARDPPIPPGELENDFAPAPAPSKRLKPKKGPGPFPEEEPFEPKPGIIVELPTKPTAPSKDQVGTFEDDDVANQEKLLPPEAKKIIKDQLSKKAIEAAYEKEERDSLPKEIPGTTPQGPFWPPPRTAPPVQPIPPRPGEANYNYGWVPPEERTPYSPPWPGGGPEVAVDRAEAVVEEINDDANAVIKTAEDAVVNTARTTENTLANTTV